MSSDFSTRLHLALAARRRCDSSSSSSSSSLESQDQPITNNLASSTTSNGLDIHSHLQRLPKARTDLLTDSDDAGDDGDDASDDGLFIDNPQVAAVLNRQRDGASNDEINIACLRSSCIFLPQEDASINSIIK